jgi:hypothetical protein
MPSFNHEAPIAVLKENPELLFKLLANRKWMEKLMDPQTLERLIELGKQRILEEAKAEGLASAIFQIATTRDLMLSDLQKTKIASCVDLVVLQNWLSNSLTANTADEIFAGGD